MKKIATKTVDNKIYKLVENEFEKNWEIISMNITPIQLKEYNTIKRLDNLKDAQQYFNDIK